MGDLAGKRVQVKALVVQAPGAPNQRNGPQFASQSSRALQTCNRFLLWIHLFSHDPQCLRHVIFYSDAVDSSAMARLDSGNETLFSDASSCEPPETPSMPDKSRPMNYGRSGSSPLPDDGVLPPKITPFSGVLSKGKIVVRPIAFKPVGMSPAGRFSNNGERYGSTPILARPGSQLTLYGSTSDLRHHHTNSFNYSLDRKSLSSSSPPLGMTSLSSLPLNHSSSKLHGCDSLENMRHCKSPASTSGLSGKMKTSFRLMSNTDSSSSLLDLTPSPSDSGVAELEAALRERDSEVVYLRQTMEHNEQAIIRVYQEKERAWERDKRRLKAGHESRVRALGQKILKLEQMLLMQSYQTQQDKQRCNEAAEAAGRESAELRQEVNLLRGRLEETEWSLCQKTGELSLLKSQLKDSQSDQTAKGHELIQLRNQLKEVRSQLERRDQEAESRQSELTRLQEENAKLSGELQKAVRHNDEEIAEMEELKEEVVTLRREIVDVCQVLKEEQDEKSKLADQLSHLKRERCSDHEVNRLKSDLDDLKISQNGDMTTDDAKHFKRELDKLKNQLLSERTDFEQERITWAQEKEKVLRYQRQLQLNYVQMFRRSRTLEAEVESLTMELELENKTKGFRTAKPPPAIEMSATIDL